MIIFFKKETGEIIGTVNDRVHFEDHLKMRIGDNRDFSIGKVVIGYIGNMKDDILQETNMHLWEQYLEFEQKKKNPYDFKVVLNSHGDVTGFASK